MRLLGRGVDGRHGQAGFRRLVECELARAEEFYTRRRRLLRRLAPDGRRIYGMMTATYHALLRRIARRPAEVFSRRLRVSARRSFG